ncbi:hypothetical protein BDF14DRAFT_761657 [Spinellus fusiger]|nr:hypothetical protein BDF14DRAFT_761657 [Spinellus fusiger]
MISNGVPEDILQNIISPTNSPYLIGGAMFQEDSELATIALHGAYLLSLLQKQSSDDNNEGGMRHIQVAVDYFMETLTVEDYDLRLKWLAYMAQHAYTTKPAVLEQLGYLIKTVNMHPVFEEYRKLQSVYESERMVSLDAKPSLILENTREAYRLFIRLCKQEHDSLAMQNTTTRLKAGNMSPLQQSFCLQMGRLSETQLSHPVVSKLFPFFEAIKNSFLTWVNEAYYRTCPASAFDTLYSILDARDYAWSLAQSATLSLDNFLIILRTIKSLMVIETHTPAFFVASCEWIDTIMEDFDFETSRSMKSLWKYFSPATLSSKELFDLETELHLTNASMDSYQPFNENGLQANDLVLRTKLDVKLTLVEGIATLYAVNENNSKEAIKLTKSLQQLPEHIRRQMESKDSVKAVNENFTAWDTALLPLFDYASTSSEMELLASLYVGACNISNKSTLEAVVEKIKIFKFYCLSKTSRPPLDMVPYQRLMWFLESDYENKIERALPSMIQDATHIWHKRLWRSSIFQKNLHALSSKEMDLGISEGSLSLFESVETLVCLNILCSVDNMSANAYDKALDKLKSLKSFLAKSAELKDKKALEIIILISIAHQLLNASADLIVKEVYTSLSAYFDKLNEFTDALLQSTVYSMDSVDIHYSTALLTIEYIATTLEGASMNTLYISAISAITYAIQHYKANNLTEYYKSTGKARVLLGLAFVSAYVPDYPVDPTSEPRLRVDLLMKKKQECADFIDTRISIETLYTGNQTNDAVEKQKSVLSQINTSLSKSATTFSLRPNVSQLEDIFVDLRYLQKSMLDHNVETLMIDLENSGIDSVLQREKLLQGNALQFLDRVQAKFPMYRDILQPLLVAVDDIKYGLRIITSHHQGSDTDEFLGEVVELLVRGLNGSEYTSTLDCHTLASPAMLTKLKDIVFERTTTQRKWQFYLRILIVLLQRLTMIVSAHGYVQPKDILCMNVLFNEIVQIWKAAQVYKRQKEIEKEQMYKTRAKKYEPLTEEEQEENDMRQTFADFNEVYEDLVEDNESYTAPKSSNATDKVEETSVLDDTDVQRIGHLHKQIFDVFSHNVCTSTNKAWDRESIQAYSVAGQLARLTTTAFSNKVDQACNAGHLRVISLAIRRLESEDSFSMTSDDTYDFYKSENVGEAKRVEPVLQRFKIRVLEILNEWPEHAVLQQILVLCDRILNFSILSPVAKFLTGFELLLQKSEDWEAYAAKHVSLKSQRDELINMIVRWRQLELNCWPKLLAAQEQYSQDSAFTWWFHIYDALNNTSFELGTEEEKTKKTLELLSALDQFIQVSSLVEFEPRLKMIDSFYRQARIQASLAETDGERLSNETVATILRNVYLYYSQFCDYARTHLAQLKKPIEKDLKDFVKIASWKDINIYALRQSAQKTHRQLHKCIRKYRDILNHSMLTIIANYNQEHAMFQYGDEKKYDDNRHGFVEQLSQSKLWIAKSDITSSSLIEWPSSAPPVKRHLTNLQSTLNKMKAFCREDLFVTSDCTKELPLETFITDTIAQIKHFQKETPAVMTDENKSMVKLQKLQKKKALVDTLKELKRLGLKWRATTLAEQNADTSQLFRLKVAELEAVLKSKDLQKKDLSTYSCNSEDITHLWSRANDYYYRSIARMTHLRNLSTIQVSKDLSILEVERSMSITEYAFSLITKERATMIQFEKNMTVLQGISVQLAAVYDGCRRSRLVSRDACLGGRLTHQKLALDKLTSLLLQAVATIKIQVEHGSDNTCQQVLVEMENLCATAKTMQKSIDYTFNQRYLYPGNATRLDFSILSEDVEEMIDSHYDTINAMTPTLLQTTERMPQTSHIIHPVIAHINSSYVAQNIADIDSEVTLTQVRDKLYSMIDAILVSVQDLKNAKAPSVLPVTDSMEEETNIETMEDNYIHNQHIKQSTLTSALHFEVVIKRCLEALNMCHQLTKQPMVEIEHVSRLLQDTYPFLQQYMLIAQHTLSEIAIHHKCTAKLTYAMVNSFTIIISKGFCMPEGASDEEEGESDGVGTGTGIGEGEGNKDVSEEIEDEEQVLGTQNDEQQKNDKKETKEEKNGMEMENDFDGELEDVDQENEDKDEDDTSDEEDEVDDEVGDVDDMDPDAVDDKMWGDEGDDKLNESDKTVDQNQGQQEQKESDVVAKEEDSKQPERKGEKPESSENQQQENGEDNEGEEDDDEDGTENNAGDKFNAEVPEAETLELPDDLNMDGDGDEEQEIGEQEEFFDAMDAEAQPEENEQLPDEDDENAFQDPLNDVTGVEDEANNNDEEMTDATAHLDENENTEEENAEEENGEGEGEEEKDEASKETGDSEKSGKIDEDEPEENTKAQNHEQPNSDDSADNQFGVQGSAGKTSMSSVGKKEGENETAESAEADEEIEKNKEKTGTAESGANQSNSEDTETSEKETKQPKSNPQRSLGDALESWRRRLADVNDTEEEEEAIEEDVNKKDSEETRDAQVKEDQAFEYVKDDEDAHDMQTLGNAAADQMQDIQIAAMDDETEDTEMHAGEMDIDHDSENAVDSMSLPRDVTNTAGERDNEGVILSKKLPNSRSGNEMEILTADESLMAHEPLEQEDIERMREELETKVSEWREEGRSVEKARELWQSYENLTHDLAMGLCEQLRLILEPTLATKLKGDYRTGKRLNMKKIIPYIASQFKKDKIWLRRTKPSKRQYQVMISVDDSKSMSESHSVQLAYETLSLISKAMSQLEVGDISITSFGERVGLLHPFDQPFTGESGASVLQQFTFAQQKTYVKKLVETSLSLFENAKHSSGPGNTELWQLQLIISDGICEDHETLQALVRKAMEQQVMIIFIVVDNKPEKDSIMNMKNVKYVESNGKLSIQMASYLETFPFQYFMILRDINALPEALSDALRQYFSFVSA